MVEEEEVVVDEVEEVEEDEDEDEDEDDDDEDAPWRGVADADDGIDDSVPMRFRFLWAR